MQRALSFYATPTNWDGPEPMLRTQDGGLRPDEGFTARYGLRLDDYYYPPLVVVKEEGNPNAEDSTDSSS